MIPSFRRIPKELHTTPGKFYTSTSFTLKVSPYKTNEPSRFSFSVSKKVAQSAVTRNKIRRRGYSVIHKLLNDTASGSLVFFQAKKGVDKLSFEVLSDEIKNLLVKSQLLKLPISS